MTWHHVPGTDCPSAQAAEAWITSGPWFWWPSDELERPAQMNLFEGFLP